jgi:mono/diheme cytochrome c family protein/glucose/arabinose dehydrogenase
MMTMLNRAVSSIALAMVLVAALAAQRGDHKGKQQPDLPADLEVPSAPVLSPADGLRSLRVQPGFRVELIAAEPLVVDPVCIAFDELGRIWAVEMRGFMPNVDGKGELAANGRVVILTDTDGDGRMDTSDVFLDGLVLPRLVAIVNQGVLVLAPPNLYLCKDLDGDGRCDEKTLIRGGFAGRNSPEHAPNGALLGMDNWLQFAKFGERLRFLNGEWVWRKQVFRGQWGISMDDFGRHYHNGNSDYLRGDMFPAHYALRNKHLGGRLTGVNAQVARDQSTWPIRITPGINRGYMKHMLRDFKLARFTGACSPVIYRDDVFGLDCRLDAFVCEPCGNFVRRSKVIDRDGVLSAENVYPKDEFLASTDERFRPVDLKVGPDGGLYVVDMYRGIVQHKAFVTTFLRKQILKRGLESPLGLGRIYRVLPTAAKRRPLPSLGSLDVAGLALALEHPSGWCRDHAQRLLIGHGKSVIARITTVIESSRQPLARLHALWVLEGVGGLRPSLLRLAMRDDHPQVRCAALRLSEPWLAGDPALRDQVVGLVSDGDPRVVAQLALSLGVAPELARETMLPVLSRSSLPESLLAAILSGIPGQELEMLEGLVAKKSFAVVSKSRQRVVLQLVKCVLQPAKPARIARILGLATNRSAGKAWQRSLILKEIAAHLDRRAKSGRVERVLTLLDKPTALLALAASDSLARRVVGRLAWPGQPLVAAKVTVRSKKELRRIKKGRTAYILRCMACHQLTGKGQPGLAPTLVASPYVMGSTDRLAAIILHGVSGPMVINGQKFEGVMPPAPATGDAEIALIMSFIRNSWGHKGTMVSTKFVTGVRKKYQGRGANPFTVAELDRWK